MRQTLGIAVFSGMLGVTAFGIFFTPVFYAVVRRFTRSPSRSRLRECELAASPPPSKKELRVDGHPGKTAASPQTIH